MKQEVEEVKIIRGQDRSPDVYSNNSRIKQQNPAFVKIRDAKIQADQMPTTPMRTNRDGRNMTGNNFFKDTTITKRKDTDMDSNNGILSIREGQLVGEIPNHVGRMNERLNDYENQSYGGGQVASNSDAYFPQIAKYHESGPQESILS